MSIVLFAAYTAGEIGPQQITHLTATDLRVPVYVASTCVAIFGLVAIYCYMVRRFERRKVSELSPKAAPIGVVIGAAFGAGLFAIVIAVFVLMGLANIRPDGNERALIIAITAAIISAVGEELIFRGVIYRLLEDSFGTLISLLSSALIFGALHGLNPGATPLSSLAVALEAGVLLGVAYTATKSLWLPIGLHFGWDFAESGIFGTAESGNTYKGIFHTTISGPSIVSGGAFGPEASIVAVVVCVVGSIIFGVAAARRGYWRPLTFRIWSE